MSIIYLAQITAWDPAVPGVKQLYFATDGYADSVGGLYYEPRIEQPALLRREIFQDGKIGGEAISTYGELVLVNNDGGLDYMASYNYGSRAVVIKMGDSSQAIASFTSVLSCYIDQVSFEWERISIRLRDRRVMLDKPIQGNKYLGNNSLPNGLEGVANDIKDMPKPLFFGRVSNITPVLVNTSRLIYQVTDTSAAGYLAEVVSVFDRGSYLARGADYTNQTDMETNAPAWGYFRIWKSGGYIRLGSSPSGLVTATCWWYSTAEQSTAAQMAKYLVETMAGLTITASDVTTLDGQNAGSIGILLSDGQTYAEALDMILGSVGAWWGFSNQNVFRMARLDAPSGSPVVTFTSVEIIGIEREVSTINGSPYPAWRITLNHDINWTVQPSDSIAGAVSADRKNWLAVTNRQTKTEDSAVKTAHLMAQEIVYDTLLAGAGYALPEATRRLTMLKAERYILNITVRADVSTINVLDLGAIVSVQINRFGLNAGKLFVIIGIQVDYKINEIQLRLWG